MGRQKLDDCHLWEEQDFTHLRPSAVVPGKGIGADNSKEVGRGVVTPDHHPPSFQGVVAGPTIPDQDQVLAASTVSLILAMLSDRWNSDLKIMSAGDKPNIGTHRFIFCGFILEGLKQVSHQVHWHHERVWDVFLQPRGLSATHTTEKHETRLPTSSAPWSAS